MTVESVDLWVPRSLGLAARGITHPMLAGWLTTPNATFGGRHPALAWAERPELVADIARLAAAHDFRRHPRG